jgi:2-methylcitrate dehydratase PrpD
MSDAAASDDSDLRNIVHAGTTLVSTSLAIAERTGASGQDVLAAIVLGYEASGRIGSPTRVRSFEGDRRCPTPLRFSPARQLRAFRRTFPA